MIKANKYVGNKNFTKWAINHTVYNSMLLEDAPVGKMDLENHINEVVNELFDKDPRRTGTHEKIDEFYEARGNDASHIEPM